MTFRRFIAISLCNILFFGSFAQFASAEVVQAYRTPSEADLQWLLGDATAQIPNVASPTLIVQAGYNSSRTGSTLAPHCDPCRPVGLPSPPIPPAPKAAANKMNTGLVDDENGVVNITSTVIDASAPVVQMSDRIPPPAEVPKEQEPDVAIPSVEPTVERLPAPRGGFDITGYSMVNPCRESKLYGSCELEESCGGVSDKSPCFCFTCLVCGDHRKHQQHPRNTYGVAEDEQWIRQLEETYRKNHVTLDAPDMIGSSAWINGYYVSTNTPPTDFALPTMLLTRPNVVEHFNAGVQNRIWADYKHWNNAVSMNNVSRGVEQFSFGLEKQMMKSNSVELRLPLLYQFGSGFPDDSTGSVELGNASVMMKQVLINRARWTISCGGGVSLPTAENWRPFAGASLKNDAYYLVSFLGAQWHPNSTTFGHFVVQADMPIEKNKLVFNGQSTKVSGQQVIRTGVQFGRWIYRTDHGKRPCRVGLFAEVDYAVVTEGSGLEGFSDNTRNIYVSEFNSQQSSLTAAVGMPMVFGKLTCANALILPMSGSRNPFSVGYNFSLSRQF